MAIDINNHPCFNGSCSTTHGRIHLPVAPKCNVQCNFCNRKYDCVNESRPGVTSAVLTPGQAMVYLGQAMERTGNLSVVGIAGPGDPFANPDETMETLRRVRAEYPEMLLCVASNGLNVEPYVEEMAELNVTHVTITVSAVDAEIGAKVYGWVRHNKHVYRGLEAGRVMIERQFAAIRALKKHDILVKVNTILIPGVNDEHVLDVARAVKAEGVDIQNCMGLCSVPDTPLESVIPPTEAETRAVRVAAGEILPQMSHCRRCRADAAGLLGEGISEQLRCCLERASVLPIEPDDDRPNVAAASREGVLVNQHLGEAQWLWVFAREGDGYRGIERRRVPAPGGGASRWKQLAETLADCRAVLTSGAGPAPTEALKSCGIRVAVTEGLIDEALAAIYDGQDLPAPSAAHRCGSGCAGDGTGCG